MAFYLGSSITKVPKCMGMAALYTVHMNNKCTSRNGTVLLWARKGNSGIIKNPVTCSRINTLHSNSSRHCGIWRSSSAPVFLFLDYLRLYLSTKRYGWKWLSDNLKIFSRKILFGEKKWLFRGRFGRTSLYAQPLNNFIINRGERCCELGPGQNSGNAKRSDWGMF